MWKGQHVEGIPHRTFSSAAASEIKDWALLQKRFINHSFKIFFVLFRVREVVNNSVL